MKLERFTNHFQDALSEAQSLVISKDQQFIEPLHIVYALLEQDGSSARTLITLSGGDAQAINILLEEEINKLPVVKGIGGDIRLSPATAMLFNVADKYAQDAGDNYISSEMFVKAAFVENNLINKIFKQCNVTKEKLDEGLKKLRQSEKVDSPESEGNRNALDKYTIDLTQRAENGKLDPVIGRDEEIRRAIQVLQRRTKNNPVLIGEPGVGKTAICEGLAQRIVKGEVPEGLKNKRVLSLDMGALINKKNRGGTY